MLEIHHLLAPCVFFIHLMNVLEQHTVKLYIVSSLLWTLNLEINWKSGFPSVSISNGTLCRGPSERISLFLFIKGMFAYHAEHNSSGLVHMLTPGSSHSRVLPVTVQLHKRFNVLVNDS